MLSFCDFNWLWYEMRRLFWAHSNDLEVEAPENDNQRRLFCSICKIHISFTILFLRVCYKHNLVIPPSLPHCTQLSVRCAELPLFFSCLSYVLTVRLSSPQSGAAAVPLPLSCGRRVRACGSRQRAHTRPRPLASAPLLLSSPRRQSETPAGVRS